MMGEPQSIPQSVIYELINETINKEAFSISCPEVITFKSVLKYIILLPHTHLQFMSIPSPLSKRNANYYPLTLFMSILWIFGYTYIITWFTYDISVALELKFSIIPMFVYPIGVSIRDVKKFEDFRVALEVFEEELPDQEISLAESYSPQIFQMTGLAGFAWFFYILVKGEAVTFENASIAYQIPLLIGVVIMKYIILLSYRFTTRKRLFKTNVIGYVLFVIVVIILDYKDDIFGLTPAK